MPGRFDDIMKVVNEKYKGKYMALASDTGAFRMDRLPTGILAIDAITYGGLPKGRIIIFWGEWSSAKTFTSFKTVARVQRTCRQCLSFMKNLGQQYSIVDQSNGKTLLEGNLADEFVEKTRLIDALQAKSATDAGLNEEDSGQLRLLKAWYNKSKAKDRSVRLESVFNLKCPKCGCVEGLTAVWTAIEDFEPDFARMCGVDCSKLTVVRAEYAEQAIDISAEILRSGRCDLMVIDSIAMMAPAKEIEESVTGDAVVSVRRSGNVESMAISGLHERWLKTGPVPLYVRAYDQLHGRFGWHRLNDVWRLPAGKRVFRIEVETGQSIKVTEDHAVLRLTAAPTEGAKPVLEQAKGKDIRSGDLLLLDDDGRGLPVKVQLVQEVPTEEVYDLSVLGAETFVANGLLVHNSAEKWQQGLAARLMNKALRRWVAGQTVVDIESEAGTKPTLIMINQVRDKIGLLYGDPSVMPGGKGQTFANSLVLRFRGGKKTKLEDTGETVSHQIHVRVEKSKCCVDEDSRIFVPSRGEFARIADIKVGESVLSLQLTSKQEIALSKVSHVTKVGRKKGFLVKLQGGRELVCSADHEFLTWGRTWTVASNLKPGMFVGVPRKAPIYGNGHISPERAALIGYLLGDGYVGGKTPITLSSADSDVIDDFSRCVKKEFGYSVVWRDKSGSGFDWAVTRKYGPGNLMRAWLKEIEMLGRRAWEKVVPSCMFSADRQAIRVMLSCYLATDGWVTLENTYPYAGFSSTSKELLDGVRLLLLGEGIVSNLKLRIRDSRRRSWELRITSFPDVIKLGNFLNYRKSRKLRLLFDTTKNVSIDRCCPPKSCQSEYIPQEALSEISSALKAANVSIQTIQDDRNRKCGSNLAKLLGQTGGGPLKRWNVKQALSHCHTKDFERLVPESVAWVKILSIDDAGYRTMYDISVPGSENYVVNDVITHNCPPDESADFLIWLREHQGNLPGSTSEPRVVFETALKEGVIERDDNTYRLNGSKYTSQKQLVAALTEDDLLLTQVRDRILEKMNERRLRYA